MKISAKLIVGLWLATLFFSCVGGNQSPDLSLPSENNSKQLLASYESLGLVADHVTCEADGSGCVLQVPADFLGDEENLPEGEEVMAPDESADGEEAASFIEVELVCKWKCEKGDQGLLFSGPPQVVEDAETVKWLEKVKEAAAELKEPVVVGIFPGLESALVLDAADDLKGMRKATTSGSLGASGMLVNQTGGKMTSNAMNVNSAVAGTAKGMTGSLGGGMSAKTQAMYVNGLLQEKGEKFTASIGAATTATGGALGVPGAVTTAIGATQTAGASSATATTEPATVSTGVILYQYDGLNRMVGRSTKEGNKETNTRWDYFGMMKLVEARENRDLGDVEFYHGARGIEAIKTGRTGEKLYALHKDHLGSTTVVTDESNGNVAEWDFYDPYGKLSQKQNSSPTGNPILYTGYYYDPSAEIYLAPYRAYDPELGRFMQRDWLGTADGPNEYAYVGNSSLGFVDPLGLSKQDPKEVADHSGRIPLHIFLGLGHSVPESAMFNAAANTLLRRASALGIPGMIHHSQVGMDFAEGMNSIQSLGGTGPKLVIALIHSGPALLHKGEVIQGSGFFLGLDKGFYPHGDYPFALEGAGSLANVNPGALNGTTLFLAGCNTAVTGDDDKDIIGDKYSLSGSFMEPSYGADSVYGTVGTATFVTASGKEIPRSEWGSGYANKDVYLVAPEVVALQRDAQGEIRTSAMPINASRITDITNYMLSSLVP